MHNSFDEWVEIPTEELAKKGKTERVYRPSNYPGPLAIDQSVVKNSADSLSMQWTNIEEAVPLNNQFVKVKSHGLWEGTGMFQNGRFMAFTIKGACFGEPTHWTFHSKPLGYDG